MSTPQSITAEVAAIQRAVALLNAQQPPQQVIDAVSTISSASSYYGQAQHIRAIATFQMGQPKQAIPLFLDAIALGERTPVVCLNLAHAAAVSGVTPDVLAVLLQGLTQWTSAEHLIGLTLQIADLFRFTKESPLEQTTALYQQLFLPLVRWACDNRQMDYALFLEGMLYERYVKALETEEHFGRCMEQIAPPFTAVGHYWRHQLGAAPAPMLNGATKVGFFIHNASMLAHIKVMLITLAGYRRLKDQPLDLTVYCFSGKCEELEVALGKLGVRLVMLNEIFPNTHHSSWQRLLQFKDLLATEQVAVLVWISLVLMMPLAFAMRLAPIQVWFALKYHDMALNEIDGYLTGSALTRFATRWGRRWRMLMVGANDWYDPNQTAQATAIREYWGGKLIIGTLARTEKMTDPTYLQAMVEILQSNPNVMFLWAGREPREEVVSSFRAGGVLQQTHFIGWVNTQLYAQVFDIFLDTFPFPCGHTLLQAMAAGKPIVMYDSPEAAQTGLWNFIQPLVDGTEGSPQERREIQSILGEGASPAISIARSPEQYVYLANRLIRNDDLRQSAGMASSNFICRYYSNPILTASGLVWHILDLTDKFNSMPKEVEPSLGS